MIINGKSKVGEAKVYATARQMKLKQQLQDYKDAVEVMRETLKLYANPMNWDNVNYPNMFVLEGDCEEILSSYTECCGGKYARNVFFHEAVKKVMK